MCLDKAIVPSYQSQWVTKPRHEQDKISTQRNVDHLVGIPFSENMRVYEIVMQ